MEFPTHAPRFQPQFNTVYQATGYTYISVWYEGGWPTTVAMLVGDQSPPTLSLGRVQRDDGNAFAP